MTPPARPTACFALLLWLLLHAAAPACAQWSGSLTLVSDDRYRGVSRSDGDPNLRAALAVDGDDGWYAGASLARTALWPGHRRLQWTAQAGRSLRLSAAAAAELGLQAVHFAGDRGHDHAEIYAGLLGQHWQARLYLSPDYFGRGARSAYAELDARWPAAGPLHLLAHAGVLAVNRNEYGRRHRADVRLGAAWSFERAEAQLAWSAAGRDGPYPAAYDGRRSGCTFSLAVFF